MHNDEVLHTKQYEKDTQEDDSDFTTGEEGVRQVCGEKLFNFCPKK